MRKGPGSRFVDVPPYRIVGLLESIGHAVTTEGGSAGWVLRGSERVFRIFVNRTHPTPAILIYTTIPAGGHKIRECGEDAIRVVAGVQETEKAFTPVSKAVKVLRTAPKKGDRVEAFLFRLEDTIRDAYRAAIAPKRCPACGGLLVPRKGRYGAFLGCRDYPRCKHSEPLR